MSNQCYGWHGNPQDNTANPSSSFINPNLSQYGSGYHQHQAPTDSGGGFVVPPQYNSTTQSSGFIGGFAPQLISYGTAFVSPQSPPKPYSDEYSGSHPPQSPWYDSPKPHGFGRTPGEQISYGAQDEGFLGPYLSSPVTSNSGSNPSYGAGYGGSSQESPKRSLENSQYTLQGGTGTVSHKTAVEEILLGLKIKPQPTELAQFHQVMETFGISKPPDSGERAVYGDSYLTTMDYLRKHFGLEWPTIDNAEEQLITLRDKVVKKLLTLANQERIMWVTRSPI